MINDRIFKCIFSVSAEHVASLTRVNTKAWWDGSVVLISCSLLKRDSSISEWSEPILIRNYYHDYRGLNGARRYVARLHEHFAHLMFEDDNQVCFSI
jgi:hypothetical protein